MKLVLRPFSPIALAPRLQPVLVARQGYATHHSLGTGPSASRRKAVTPFNDNGHVPWSELSVVEKASRATQQTFNFGLVAVGLVLTGGVGYFLFQDVFSPESKTAYFNRAVDRIKKHPDCVALLGQSSKISAYGEETFNKWRRARPIASTLETDPRGTQHLRMHFYVEGPLNKGVVNVHLVKNSGHDEFEYKYFSVDIKDHPRIYLENANSTPKEAKKFKLFGVNWN
ncbi:import inner membrane translocase subunit tim-21, mitochondrial [Durotheca rogersii]|uniref:import inner membrane translocase subunit tim-21, mitochondrial n=1 Tax=Durotheca rogersii TaxID=419775 RepID=UPI00221F3EA3|nr:import inner membrane translocase subunit tim-21, mitochondrial [Durotheca rogersii]KAI5866790.1 import inner membrane translocase subunit tim-21, mitochondrial [Durotheca rogersii]